MYLETIMIELEQSGGLEDWRYLALLFGAVILGGAMMVFVIASVKDSEGLFEASGISAAIGFITFVIALLSLGIPDMNHKIEQEQVIQKFEQKTDTVVVESDGDLCARNHDGKPIYSLKIYNDGNDLYYVDVYEYEYTKRGE